MLKKNNNFGKTRIHLYSWTISIQIKHYIAPQYQWYQVQYTTNVCQFIENQSHESLIQWIFRLIKILIKVIVVLSIAIKAHIQFLTLHQCYIEKKTVELHMLHIFTNMHVFFNMLKASSEFSFWCLLPIALLSLFFAIYKGFIQKSITISVFFICKIFCEYRING